jgi:hypothetical protein
MASSRRGEAGVVGGRCSRLVCRNEGLAFASADGGAALAAGQFRYET